MNISVNGTSRDIADGARVADLVAEPRGCAVAVNGAVVPKAAWDTELAPGDRVEIVTAHQGG